jgi:hypothetical protein
LLKDLITLENDPRALYESQSMNVLPSGHFALPTENFDPMRCSLSAIYPSRPEKESAQQTVPILKRQNKSQNLSRGVATLVLSGLRAFLLKIIIPVSLSLRKLSGRGTPCFRNITTSP